MSELMKELDRRIEAAWMVEPQDVRRMLKHNDDMGRNFAQWVYSYMDMSQLQEVLYQYYKICLGGNADLDTMKSVACSAMNNVAANSRSSKMEDLMSILYRASSAANGAKDLNELAALLRKVQRYINVMFYAIDLAIPWEGMCQAYNKLMKDYVPATREGAVDVSDQ